MPFIEENHIVNGKLDKQIISLINNALAKLDKFVKEFSEIKGLNETQEFLMFCNVLVLVDSVNIFIVGTNDVQDKVQNITYTFIPRNIRNLSEAFDYSKEQLGFENPFGLIFEYEVLYYSEESKNNYLSIISKKYIGNLHEIIKREELLKPPIEFKPIFKARNIKLNKNLFFCLNPFKDPFNIIFYDHIKPTVESINRKYRCIRANDIFNNEAIIEDIWIKINEARIIISDLTGKNPNVFYETGISHTIGKEVILITQDMNDVPFDLKHFRCLVYEYNPRGMDKFENSLHDTIINILKR